ncbi:MAG: ABC transporter ATP-binding protein [Pseudobutyrivibrio ruminis]|nr:ABC transporter ATP-binding protein [Pseudobutyrivibrio ruminis]
MKNIIEINNVSFHYKGSDEGLLNNVSLSIAQGETVLLCGASGSGKTTIIRLINGLIPHYYPGELSGSVNVAGHDIKNTELYDLAGVVGTVFQNPRSQFFSVDTDGEIVFGPENIGLAPKEIKNRAAAVIEEMNLKKLMGRSLFELSGGEKQKIACGSVSALLPNIILLDEPSSNLDWGAIEELKKEIKRWKSEGKTIIISEHRLWYLKDVLDRVIYMDNGNIAGEYTGKEFFAFSDSKIKELKLRPVKIEEKFMSKFSSLSHESVNKQEPTDVDSIELKNFYFSYEKRPYIFRKKKLTGADGDILSLNIQELNLPKGTVTGITGKNGTGKSTFLRCLCGLEKDCKGEIISGDKIYKGKSLIKISYMVMQDVNHQLFTDSVEAEVLLSMQEENKAKCTEILDSLGLLEFKDKHPMALSGGQKQRVAIASAIAAGAKLLLFDEPTSGLDYLHMEKVASLLKELANSGSTVLVSTHDPELIELCCDYVLQIDEGKVAGLEKI